MHSEVRNGDSLVFEVMNGPSRDRIHSANMYARIFLLIWSLRWFFRNGKIQPVERLANLWH